MKIQSFGRYLQRYQGVQMTLLGVYVDQKSLVFPGLIQSQIFYFEILWTLNENT